MTEQGMSLRCARQVGARAICGVCSPGPDHGLGSAAMSFDLYFLTRGPDETWQDAMERLEDAAASPAELDEEHLARWDSVRTHVRPLLPGAEEVAGESHRELSDDASGIQVSLSHGELSLSIPYWYSGPDAEALVARLRAVVVAVEGATGLTAYDPQADAPFVGGGDRTAAATFDAAQVALRRHRDVSNLPVAGGLTKSGPLKRMFRRSR